MGSGMCGAWLRAYFPIGVAAPKWQPANTAVSNWLVIGGLWVRAYGE